MGSAFSRSRSRSGGGEADMGPYLKHDNIYKITSLKDKNVIEVPISSTGAPIIVKKWSNGQNQKFKASQTSPGAFKISSLTCPNHGWDFQPGNAVLLQTEWNGSSNQLWTAEEILPNSKICVIRSAADGRCLRNMGEEKQIALVSETRGDKKTHWKIEPTY